MTGFKSFSYLSFLIKTSTLFLLRSKKTALVLSFIIFSAVATMVFLSALASGTNDAMVRNSVGLYTGHIFVSGIESSFENLLDKKKIKAVLKRKELKGLLKQNGKFSTIELIGVNIKDEIKYTGLERKKIKGRYPEKGKKEVYLGYTIARDLMLKPGDSVIFEGFGGSIKEVFKVSGIFRTGLTEYDNSKVFCDKSYLPDNLSTLNAGIFLKDGVDSEKIKDDILKILQKASAITWKKMMPDLEQLIKLNNICMTILIAIVFIIVSISISGAFMIFILKNFKEYGVMKVMGLSSFETAFLIYSKILIMIVTSSLFGVFAGFVLVLLLSETGIDISSMTSHNRYFLISGVIYPRMSFQSLVYPPVSALFFCAFTAIWPAVTVARSRMSEILRSV